MSAADDALHTVSLPLTLGPDDAPVVVRDGAVHVFSVRPSGVRYPVGTLQAGDVAFPVSGPLLLTAGASAVVESHPADPDQDAAARGRFTAMVAGTLGVELGAGTETAATFGAAITEAVDRAWDADLLERERRGRVSLAAGEQTLDRAYRDLEEAATGLGAGPGGPAHPLVRAVSAVGEHEGFAVVVPSPEALASSPDPVRLIAHKSGVRFRVVTLAPGWRTAAATAYVGFLGGTDGSAAEAVALVPGGGGWRVVSADRRAEPLGDELAARLQPRAVEFYTPLPRGRAVAPRDVLRVGARGSGRLWWLTIALGIAVALISLGTPILTNIVVATVIPEREYGVLAQVALVLVTAAFVAFVFNLVQAYAIGRITQNATRNTQAAFWDRVLSLPAPFFRRFSSGDLTMRVLAVDSLQQLMSGPVVSALLAAGFGLVNLVLMFRYSVELATVASVALLLTVTVLVVATWRISREATSALAAGREGNAWMMQLLAGLPKIRLAHAESRVQARYLEILRRQAAAMSRQTRVVGRVNAWFAFAATGVTAAFFLVIDHEWHGAPPISTADYLAFASAYGLAFAGVQGLSVLISPIANAGPTFDLLRPLMEEQPETAADGQDPGRLTGRIELRDVTFRYDAQGPLVLKGVDLVVAPGELIALTGSSGAGKSTITRLLLGFDVPEEGRILFDGRDLADLDVSLVRRQMGVVVQSGTVMRDSVLKNILGGVAGDEAVAWSAAERAAIADDIRAMPMGMQSIIDAGNISGGQAQRILLARALARDPSVLILDEATSALDNVSQKVVTEAINALGVTRIVIAHRLSTIRAADRIVVMDQGMVVESGSYDELRAADGVFARLVARQLR